MADNIQQLPIPPKAITDKYAVSGTTLSLVAKADPKDRINVEIGDSKQADFYPQIKLMRWDNEVNCSFRIVGNGLMPSVRFEGEKTIWAQGDIEAHFYDFPASGKYEGGYELEIVLKSKPLSNRFDFTIQTKGLDFFYQPPLTSEYYIGQRTRRGIIATITETDVMDDSGHVLSHREPNVIGSYAVYHGTKGIWNDINGKAYKAGKAFHIYRPKVKDALGAEVWADLNIDVAQGIMSITVPQDFLDKATYPVTIDPNYGYTTVASTSWAEYMSPTECFAVELGNAPEDGTLNYIHWALYRTDLGSGFTARTAFYGTTSSKPATRLGYDSSGFTVTDTTSPGSFHVSLNDYAYTLVSGTPYWAALGNFVTGDGGDELHVGYDTAAGYEGYFNNVTTPPSPWTDYTYGPLTSKRFSVYCEYTAAGGALSASLYDTVRASESVTALLPILVKSIYDTVNVSENVSRALLMAQSLYDTVNISELVTVNLLITCSVYDNVAVSEQVSPLLPVLLQSVYDTISVSESVTGQVVSGAGLSASLYDTVNSSESVTPNLLMATNLYDLISASEQITQQLVIAVSIYDTARVSEQVSRDLLMAVSLYDTVSLSEQVTPRLPFLTATLYDTVSFTELVTPLLPVIVVSVYETVAVSDVFVVPTTIHHFTVIIAKTRQGEAIATRPRQVEVITAKSRQAGVIMSK